MNVLRRCVVLACCAFTSSALPHHEPAEEPGQQRISRHAAGWPVGAFALSDHQGNAFTQERLRGRWTFVLLGDTHCAAPCASALGALAGLVQRIATAEAVKTTQVLFVSLDPERDTAQVLRQYVTAYDARFVAATGAHSTLVQLADDIGASDAKQPYRGSLVLIGPDGAIRAEFLPPFEARRLTAAFLKTRARG